MSAALLDILTLVTSDKRFPLEVTKLMASGEVRLVHTFRTGSECLRALALDDMASRRLVLIDKLISDISPANLCDAIRLAHPNLGIIMVVEPEDVEGVQRAMLAGAKATISRQASSLELSAVLERVIEAVKDCASLALGTAMGQAASLQHSTQSYGAYEHRGVLIPFISARGGAGKSTLSSSLAYLAAEAHIDTALIDFDLQFGDLNFLFATTFAQVPVPAFAPSSVMGKQPIADSFAHRQVGFHQKEAQRGAKSCAGDDLLSFLQETAQTPTGLKATESLRRFGRQLAPNLRLYAPRAAVEKSESLAQFLPAALERLRSEHDLLIVNTGAYWTLFHAELLEQSDLVICTLDQSITGVRATAELRELCRRLGIPPARLLFVMNRMRDKGLRAQDVAELLRTEKVFCVRDAGTKLTTLFDSGDFSQLLQQTAFMSELYEILSELAVRSDLCIHDAVSLRFAMRREGGTRLNSPKRGLLRRA